MNKKLILFITFITIISSFCLAAQTPTLPPPIPGTEIKFYVADNGLPTGPFNLIEIGNLIRSRRVNQSTLVWRDGMSGWTEAGVVSELTDVFSTQQLAQTANINDGYTQTEINQSTEFNPENIQPTKNYKPLTDSERHFMNEKLIGKWNVNPTDKAAMKQAFNKNLSAGISLAVVGTVLQGTGAGVMSGLAFAGSLGLIIGSAVGGNLMLAGLIIGPLCTIGFVNAGRVGNVYKKTTGQKLFAILERTNINGGYDWENKEITVAMGIKL